MRTSLTVFVGTAVIAAVGISSAWSADAKALALEHFSKNGAAYGLNKEHSLGVRGSETDSKGATHVRMDQSYKGVRVFEAEAIAHVSSRGRVTVTSDLRSIDRELSTVASLTREDAIRTAVGQVDPRTAYTARAELMVLPRSPERNPTRDRLAYRVVISTNEPSENHVFVDAQNAEVAFQFNNLQTAASAGTGKGYFNGTVSLTTDSISGGFALRDPSRGSQYTVDMKNRQGGKGALFTDADNTWGDFTLANRQTVGVDAQYGTAETWDYFKNVHGRNGIANNGVGAYNRVHFGQAYNNAYWSDSCFCMTYGDGDGVTFNPFDSLDVAGHEMTHGVTSRTANLTYSGESGGLNEATSDIFGTMVEYRTNNANDTPDYKIGEKLYKSGTSSLRYMYSPNTDGVSADCWYSGVGSLNVHYSSGVANHFFYLLAEGSNSNPSSPTCNAGDTKKATGNGSVSGIGRAAAEKIWYRALTVYMTASTTYAQARTASLNAARDLYGSGSAQYNGVASAWSAVSVN